MKLIVFIVAFVAALCAVDAFTSSGAAARDAIFVDTTNDSAHVW